MDLKKHLSFRDENIIENFIIVLIGSFFYIMGAKLFIDSAGLYSGGILGIAQLLSNFIPFLDDIEFTYVYLILNIPIFILSFSALGKRFSVLSLISVITSVILSATVKVNVPAEIGNDPFISAVFGGLLIGIGVGMCLKVGASTGGMDVIAQYISKKIAIPFIKINFTINGGIVLIAGFAADWRIALYTIINMFVSMTVIGMIYTRYKKLVVTIITENPKEIIEQVHSQMIRGVTIISALGAYSQTEKTMLYTVVTSYELYNIKKIIEQCDPSAFVSVTRNEIVIGASFAKR